MANTTKKYDVYDPRSELQQVTVAAAPEIAAYQGVQYSNSYRDAVDTSYYDNAISKYKDYAEQNRTTQLGQAGTERDSQLKQAYIQRAQNERKMQENLARSGIRGGATETSMLNLANQYGQTRSAINSDYSKNVNTINSNIDQLIFDYTMDTEARAEEYRQNMANAMWQADREDYATQWNAQNEAAWNMWNAQNEANATNVANYNNATIDYANAMTERNANITNIKREDASRITADWANKYSKSSISTINSKIKELNKKIKKASGSEKERLIAQRSGLYQAKANK